MHLLVFATSSFLCVLSVESVRSVESVNRSISSGELFRPQEFLVTGESRSRSEQFGADLQQGADLEDDEGYDVSQDQQRRRFDERHAR